MTLTDDVQILILLVLLLILLKPVYARWLPRQWRGLVLRVTPPRALKYEGIWRRNSSESDKT
ncbi:cellulose biosynthesis protein BcsF [Erwinia sp. BNK-24-b]|uniref:cellulose biosynthesis protein BcsF n=1 Tax=Erwinia TaxID=551 RepID=UPI001FED4DA1|nr:cellulose biosynthesis protein BcsF [Erwinia phyllosphaerae]MBV4367458.1 cellulose biosynthesis protein BcsF [Erwinia phyllosphaerae]